MPSRNRKEVYKFLAPHLRDESQDYKMPAQYMFKDVPADLDESVDPVAVLMDNLDRHGVETAMLGFNPDNPDCVRALTDHGDRIIACLEFDPNDTMGAIRKVKQIHEQYGLKAVSTFPAGYRCRSTTRRCTRSTPCAWSSTCRSSCAWASPVPACPFKPQHVELIDEVMYDFPELTFVMRHGAQPWTELAMKLMLKWPNLYYSTSAFAPKHYDKVILDYANTRGADKVIYAGYFPAGLSMDRIMAELPDVPAQGRGVAQVPARERQEGPEALGGRPAAGGSGPPADADYFSRPMSGADGMSVPSMGTLMLKSNVPLISTVLATTMPVMLTWALPPRAVGLEVGVREVDRAEGEVVGAVDAGLGGAALPDRQAVVAGARVDRRAVLLVGRQEELSRCR